MRTHATHAGTAPAGHARAAHARGRYLEVPGKPEAVPEITHDQIARRAHQIYLARSDSEGDAFSDWLTAKRELKAAALMAVPPRTQPEPDRCH